MMDLSGVKPSGVFAGRAVLVVDGDSKSRQDGYDLLTKLGFARVEMASDGSDALRRLDKSRFDLIVTEIKMKPVGGLDMVKSMRSGGGLRFDQQKAQTPVVFLTTSASQMHLSSAKDLGARGYFLKPLDPQNLRTRLAKIFGG